jgi:hypothetical protein
MGQYLRLYVQSPARRAGMASMCFRHPGQRSESQSQLKLNHARIGRSRDQTKVDTGQVR